MNFKRVITFGDSFTRGSELSDCIERNVGKLEERSQRELEILKSRKIGPFSEIDLYGKRNTWRSGYSLKTWPALLANHFQSEYCCQSISGCSNQTIIRTLTKFINDITDDDLIIIDWTFSDRWDYIDLDEVFVDDQWKTLRPSSTKKTEIEKFYFKYIQSELWNKWESLRAIMLAKYMLMSKNIKFFMTCEDNLIFDTAYHNNSYIINFQKELELDIFWFENSGFYRWAKDKNFPRGKENDHPLDEAHQAAFEYIINNYEFT
jgi:hypothetical protein